MRLSYLVSTLKGDGCKRGGRQLLHEKLEWSEILDNMTVKNP